MKNDVAGTDPLAAGGTTYVRQSRPWRREALVTASMAMALTALTVASPSQAQDAATSSTSVAPQTAAEPRTDPALPDIVVTAEKRNTSLQRTPLAVTALSADALSEHQVRDLKDIQALVPNFKIGEAAGITQIAIRGVGSSVFKPGSEGEVAVNENEVYVSRPIAQPTGLYDVSSLEVLRGPQGTLYGRNATAGAVNIITARPTEKLSGFANVTVGNYGLIRLEGAVGGELDGDGAVGLRIAGFRETRNGYGKNIVTGNDVDNKDAYGVRGTLVVKPSPELTGTAIVEYYKQDDNSGQTHYFGAAGLTGLPGASGLQPVFVGAGGFVAPDVRDIAFPFDGRFTLRTFAATGIIEWDPQGPFSVKSVTGYREQKASFDYNIDASSSGAVRIFANEPANQFSQELQIRYDSGDLNVTAGGYYFSERDDADPVFLAASAYVVQNAFHIAPVAPYTRIIAQSARFRTRAYAGFGQATYRITPELSLTAGIRYSDETKDARNGFGLQLRVPFPSTDPFPALVDLPSARFTSWTPKFGVQYQATPRTLLFASYSQGFKSGGFDVGTAQPKPYQPETLKSYEAGIKTTFANGRVRANVTGFYYDYSNLQVQQLVGIAVQTSNAASARVYGVEGEFNFLLGGGFELDANGSWTHSRYGNYCGADAARPLIVTPASCATAAGTLPANTADFRGNQLTNSPEWRGYLAGQYSFDVGNGKMRLRTEVDYASRTYFTPGNFNFVSQKPFAKLDAYITYEPKADLQLRLFVKNVTDVTTRTSAVITTNLVGNTIVGGIAPPRTFGGQVNVRF